MVSSLVIFLGVSCAAAGASDDDRGGEKMLSAEPHEPVEADISGDKGDSPLMVSVTDESEISRRYVNEIQQDVATLEKFKVQLKDLSHPSCEANVMTSVSVCFRMMIADFPIRSMTAFDMLNVLAAEATTLDRDRHVPKTITQSENDAHQVLLELNFLENQIFVLEKVTHDDLLVHKMPTQTKSDAATMADHRLKEKQKYVAFWRKAHVGIRGKFFKVHKLIQGLQTGAGSGATQTLNIKYTELLDRYKKVYQDAISKVFPTKKFN